jgi:hypothetical protein
MKKIKMKNINRTNKTCTKANRTLAFMAKNLTSNKDKWRTTQISLMKNSSNSSRKKWVQLEKKKSRKKYKKNKKFLIK